MLLVVVSDTPVRAYRRHQIPEHRLAFERCTEYEAVIIKTPRRGEV